MPFSESNENLEQNLEIRREVERMGVGRLCLCAIFFLEHKIAQKRKLKPDQETYKDCLNAFYDHLVDNGSFGGEFDGYVDFCNKAVHNHQITRWYSLDCVLDSLKSVKKRPGAIEYHRRNEIKNIVGIVLEEYYEIPITEIINSLC